MLFHIIKYKNGYRVMDDNQKTYSKKLLSKKTAQAQMRALYANIPESKVFRGSGFCLMDNDMYLDGSGFFSDFFNKAKDVAKGIVNRISGVSRGIRTGYSPKVRDILNKYGDFTITNIYIRRKPIVNMIDRFLNLISFGQLDKAKAELGYDKLFHLSMVLLLRPTNKPSGSGGAVYVLVEKNEVINMDMLSYKQVISQPHLQFGIPSGTSFRDIIERAQHMTGSDFFKYDAFNNNCQMFIAGILQASGLLNEKFKLFILQDTESILKRLPSFIQPLARGATNIAALADVAISGEGMSKMSSKDFVAEHKKMVKLLNDESDETMRGGADRRQENREQEQLLNEIVGRLEEIRGEIPNMIPEVMVGLAFEVMDMALQRGIQFDDIREFVNTHPFANNTRRFVNQTIDAYIDEFGDSDSDSTISDGDIREIGSGNGSVNGSGKMKRGSVVKMYNKMFGNK